MDIKTKIYNQIRNEIIYGKLMPGERLPETGLSKRFGCSRAPVREALGRLESEGFVHRIPNQGIAVNKSSPEEIIDYYSILEVLESQAVEWATERLQPEDIEQLETMNHTMKQISNDDPKYIEKWIDANVSFHKFFSEKCGNEKMVSLVEEIRLRITRFRYLSFMLTSFGNYLEDHEAIIQALRDKDAKRAKQLMRTHIERAKQVLVKQFFYNPTA
jgi:DNA-binding GntR family transcriptional regulator